MDRSLDKILAEPKEPRRTAGLDHRGGGRPSQIRRDYPRGDGVRKSYRDEPPRNFDSEWVHDRFEGSATRNRRYVAHETRYPPDTRDDSRGGCKLRVENLHYELTHDELHELFSRIGTVLRLELLYDRAGRSEGTAFVTFEHEHEVQRAIDEYDGANAAGQPIRLFHVSAGLSRGRHPGFSRPLVERITYPSQRSRSDSPRQRDFGPDDTSRSSIGRFGRRSRRSRSRSPFGAGSRDRGRLPPGRLGGPRSARDYRTGSGRNDSRGRRNGGASGGVSGGRGQRLARDGRPRKTQEELDAEMEDYFTAAGGNAGNAQPADREARNLGPANVAVAAGGQVDGDDIDMIE